MLPVQKSHLRESGIGKLVVAMAADPGETRDNRELIKQVRERARMGLRRKSAAVEDGRRVPATQVGSFWRWMSRLDLIRFWESEKLAPGCVAGFPGYQPCNMR